MTTTVPEWVGAIRMFAGPFSPTNWLDCDGRHLDTGQWELLFALLHQRYGGAGGGTFGLPDLRPAGHGGPKAWDPAIPRWEIGAIGLYPPPPTVTGPPMDVLGRVERWGPHYAPSNYALCDGSAIAISANPALFNLIGTKYGGDGKTTFNLPDLREVNPATHERYWNPARPIWIICVNGAAPNQAWGDCMGFIQYFAPAGVVPPDYMLCEGQALSVASHGPLFSILVTAFGGDGAKAFNLPDLREVHPQTRARTWNKDKPVAMICVQGAFPTRQ